MSKVWVKEWFFGRWPQWTQNKTKANWLKLNSTEQTSSPITILFLFGVSRLTSLTSFFNTYWKAEFCSLANILLQVRMASKLIKTYFSWLNAYYQMYIFLFLMKSWPTIFWQLFLNFFCEQNLNKRKLFLANIGLMTTMNSK